MLTWNELRSKGYPEAGPADSRGDLNWLDKLVLSTLARVIQKALAQGTLAYRRPPNVSVIQLAKLARSSKSRGRLTESILQVAKQQSSSWPTFVSYSHGYRGFHPSLRPE